MSAHETVIQFPKSRQGARGTRQTVQLSAVIAELLAARAREQTLREEIGGLLRHHNTLAQEFENRLLNSLEVIANQLSLQSRAAARPKAAAQLRAAARRITAVGRSQCRPDRLDQ